MKHTKTRAKKLSRTGSAPRNSPFRPFEQNFAEIRSLFEIIFCFYAGRAWPLVFVIGSEKILKLKYSVLINFALRRENIEH